MRLVSCTSASLRQRRMLSALRARKIPRGWGGANQLKLEPDTAPDPQLPEALKLFPERLVSLGLRDQKTREQIAEMAGRHPSQVGRWFSYKGLQELAVSAVIGLENGFRLAPGTLLSPYSIELGCGTLVLDASTTGEAMGVAPSVMRALTSGSGARMSEFGIGLRRAILGAVHLMGLPLETVLKAAEAAHAKVGAADLQPEAWLGEMRPYLEGKKTESGTFPSSSSIKIG